jgi:hypothetical protein
MEQWESLWSEFGPPAASTPSCARRYREHLLAHLLCLGRHTVSSLISAHGGQFADWTAHYDLYAQGRVDPRALFRGVLSHVEAINGPRTPLTVALDDTILRKTGRTIPGAAYRKDPLGPAFNVNLVWAQRMVQFSAAVPGADGNVRMVPVDFVDASTPRKPRKGEPEGRWTQYRETMKRRNLRKKAGGMDLRLVVVRPVPHRGPGGKRRCRQPAHLVCTDPDMPVEEVLQRYVWRWDIEVNHRDEKTLLGVGKAQVRNPLSAWSVPASAVAAYAMLHVAAIHAYGWSGKPGVIPPPKWRDPRKKRRASTLDLVNELRRELWTEAIREEHLSDFANAKSPDTKSPKYPPSIASCLFAATAWRGKVQTPEHGAQAPCSHPIEGCAPPAFLPPAPQRRRD